MNIGLKRLTLSWLRWSVGLVVLLESLKFVFSESAARAFAHTGLPAWIRPLLGGIEIVAVVLFLVPAATLIGAYALLLVFSVAVVIHILHGWYDVGALVIYAMAVMVCIAHQEQPSAEVTPLDPVD